MFFSNSKQSFFSEQLKKTYESLGNWPKDAQMVSISMEEKIRSLHMSGRVAFVSDGSVIDHGFQPGYEKS